MHHAASSSHAPSCSNEQRWGQHSNPSICKPSCSSEFTPTFRPPNRPPFFSPAANANAAAAATCWPRGCLFFIFGRPASTRRGLLCVLLVASNSLLLLLLLDSCSLARASEFPPLAWQPCRVAANPFLLLRRASAASAHCSFRTPPCRVTKTCIELMWACCLPPKRLLPFRLSVRFIRLFLRVGLHPASVTESAQEPAFVADVLLETDTALSMLVRPRKKKHLPECDNGHIHRT